MTHLPSKSQSPKGRRALGWSVMALLLIALVVALALVLGTEGPGTAGPGDPPSPATDEPTSPGPDPPTISDSPAPSDTPTDDPSDAPTDPTTAPDSPDPTSSPTSEAPSPAAPGELNEDSATDVVSSAIGIPLTSPDSEDALADALTDVAVEGYAAELEAQWLELTSQGWSTTGSPRVESLEITELDTTSDPATAEMTACIDSSEVTTVDAEGASIGDPSAVSPRAFHLFTMVQGDDGIWRISSHSFPNDPSC